MARRLLAIAFILLSLPVAAAAEMRMITVDAAPWASSDGQGRIIGAFPEIVAEMSIRTAIPMGIEIAPFARIERELEAGQQDCTIILWNEARSRIVERGEDVYAMPFGVVARKGIALKSYESLAPLTISVLRNLSLDPRFDNDKAIRKSVDKDYEMGLLKVAHGRLDAVAGAVPTIQYIADKAGVGHHLGPPLILNHTPLALQCSRTSPRRGRMADLNAAIRAMRADGTLAQILARNHYQ